MKIRVSLKDPDVMQDAVDDAVKLLPKPEGISEGEWESLRDGRADAANSAISHRWMKYGEYLVVEFDLDAGTATVIEN